MNALDRWLSRIESLFAFLAICGLLFIIASVCLEIVLRTFFALPQSWVIELSEYALLYITFLGTSWLFKREGHVAVDLVTGAVGVVWKRRLGMFSAIVGLFVGVVLSWFGTLTTIEQWQRGLYRPTILEFPTWIVVAIIPVGAVVLSLRCLLRLLALRAEAKDAQ